MDQRTESSATKFSDQLEEWLGSDEDKTLESLVATFKEKSFAILFILLLGLPALPLPTGGATHVMEIIAALLALELIVGRRAVWLPRRWRDREIAGVRQRRFIASLMRGIRRLERLSRPDCAFCSTAGSATGSSGSSSWPDQPALSSRPRSAGSTRSRP